jgi:hypothetical protein
MRARRALLVCAAIFVASCAQPYLATSSNPALVQVPVVGISDSLSLIAVDGQTMGTPAVDRDFHRIDPGVHRLTVTYQGNPLVLNAKLEGGHRYRIVCETIDVSAKGYVRDLGTNKIVSNIAEQPLMLQTARPVVSPPLAIPVAPHR